MKEKGTAAVLALFTGNIGLQWFYLERTRNGLLSVLFCWTLIPGLISLVHFFQLLAMDQKNFLRKYDPDAFEALRLEKLEKLHELKSKGVIKQEEFESAEAEWRKP